MYSPGHRSRGESVKKLVVVLVTMALIAVACGDDDTASTTAVTAAPPVTEAPTATAAPTTTAAPPTTAPPTTTASPVAAFASAELPEAVLQDGDPWSTPPQGVAPIELTIDDIWPLEGALQFPDERAIYEEAGFVDAAFAFFADSADGLVLTGAHLFDDAAGATAALEVLEGSFSDVELVAAITGLAPGALTEFATFYPGDLGDFAVGVRLTGDTTQVVGVVWATDNLLQFVRAAMPLDDADRDAATLAVVGAMAGRMGDIRRNR